MSNRRERRTYSKEFKQQMVDLYQSGKPRVEIIREYELTPSAFDKWIRQANSSVSASSRIEQLTPINFEHFRSQTCSGDVSYGS